MNNDLISRSALKKDFKARLEKAKNWKENALNKGDDEIVIRADATIDFICEVIMTIDNAPTVAPTFGLFKEMLCSECDKRPRGEWIEHYDSSDGFTWLTCSRCLFKAYEDDYNFCPNCGAKMQKEGRE